MRVYILALALAAASPAVAAPVSWTGGGDGATWSDPANWSPAGVPGPASDVSISSALVIAGSSTTVSAASLDLGAAATAQLSLSTGALVSGLFRVRAGSVLTFLSTQPALAGTFQVDGLGLVEQSGPVVQSTTAITIAASVFTLAAGATVQAMGRGFAGGNTISAGNGPGPGGSGSGGVGAGGGGHGGKGGAGGLSANGGVAYGSLIFPTALGSGGGGGLAPCLGGAGGGGIRVTASTLTIDGAILADGIAGVGGCAQAGGGGAGGSILIEVGTLFGNGSLLARGGAGGTGSGALGRGGGGGGGGRITVRSTGLNLSAVAISSAAGQGGAATTSGAGGNAGSAFIDPKVWVGAGAADCKDPANWVGSIAPLEAENVVFGSTASLKSCTWDFPPLAVGSLTLEAGYQGVLTWATAFSSVNGNFAMQGGTLASTGIEFKVGGNFTQGGGGFSLGAGTVTLTGAGGSLSVLAASRFNHLVVETGASITAASTITVGGNFTVRVGAGLTLVPGTFLHSTGFLTQLGAVTASGASVILEGTLVQQARWNDYGNLRVSNPAGVVLLAGVSTTAVVRGNIQVDAGSSLSAGIPRIELGGNWSSSGVFSAAGATVAFIGPGAQSILGGATSFHYLQMASTGGVFWAVGVVVSSGVTFSTGVADLGTATHSVQGYWTVAGGEYRGSSGTLVLNGTVRQPVMGSTDSVFGRLVSSNPAGVLLTSDAALDADLELVAGAFDFSARILRLRGRLARLGAVPPVVASATVVLDGTGLQGISLGGAALNSITITNSGLGARLDSALVVRGTFTVAPGAVFDGSLSSVTLSGAAPGWNTAGALYRSSSVHRVAWQSPAPGRVLVASGSTVAASVDVTGVARLAGQLYISSGALRVFFGGTLDGRGSTVTLRGDSDLTLSAGSAYQYNTGSWIIYEGSGTDRGLGLSTGPVQNIHLEAATSSATFRFGALSVDGSLSIATGTARLIDGVRLALRGDLRSIGGGGGAPASGGGVFDFSSSPRSTIVFTGATLQVLAAGPSDAFAFLEVAGSSSVALASGTLVRVGGGLTLSAGRLEGSDARLDLKGDWTGLGGVFAAQRSTVTFSSAAAQRQSDVVHQVFNGLSIGPGARFFSASFDAAVLSATHPASGLTLSTAGVHTISDLRVNGSSPATPVTLQSGVPGTPASLSVLASTVTAALLRDINVMGGTPVVFANDGRSIDGGGNAGIEFRPTFLVIVPGETFAAGTGRAGAAVVETAGTTFTVTVQAVSDRFLPVVVSSLSVVLRTGDPYDSEPGAAALSSGSASFSVSLRRAEPAPLSVQIWATGAGSGVLGATVPVQPGAFSTLQILFPGEGAVPGSPGGRSGIADFQISGVAFQATVRAVDGFANLVSGLADAISLRSVAPSSVTLPSPQALVAGSATLSGITFLSTGVFTLSATDLSSAAFVAAPGSPLTIFSLSLSSPALNFALPDGASVGTLGGNVGGGSADSVAVTAVGAAVQHLASGLWFDWSAAFVSTAPVFQAAVVTPFRGKDVTWALSFTDSFLVSGSSYVVSVRAINPAGFTTTVASTITFNRGILQFSPGDGEGAAIAVPASTGACQAVVATVTFTVGAAGLGPGGAVALHTPVGWTTPLGISAAIPPPLGYVSIVSTSLAWSVAGSSEVLFSPTAIGSVTLGLDWVAVRVREGAPNSFRPGEAVTFFYHGFPPARSVGRHLIEVRSRSVAAGALLSVATAPAITLSAGPPRGLEFQDPSVLALGALQTAPTMFLTLTDGCGNAAPALSAVVASLSAGQPAAAGFDLDLSAAFFMSGGASTGSVTVPTGASLSPAFTMRSSTSGVASEFLRATAMLAGLPAEALRLVLVRASSVTPSGVSIDSGTLTAGATSVTLVPGGGAPASGGGAPASGGRAVLRFTLADPLIAWDVAVATEAGFTAPYFRASGFGDAAAPLAVPWDGVVCGAVCSFAPPARYLVRVRAAGIAGPTLEIRVATSPFIYGSLGASGAGASVSVEGPGAGYGAAARADAGGAFRVDGLRAATKYAVLASSVQLVYGQPMTLSTGVFSVAAATAGGSVGPLAIAAPALVRVKASLPVLTPIEVFGTARLRAADGAEAALAVLHFSKNGASSDDGAVAVGRVASTWTVLAVAVGTYTLEIDLPGLGLSTAVAGVYASTASIADISLALPRLATVSGVVVLPSTQPYGTAVSLSATRAGAAQPTRFAAFLVAAAGAGGVPSSGAFRLFGLDPGTWTLNASAQGFLSVSTTLAMPGSADVGDAFGVGGPKLGLGFGGVLSGTITVNGDTRGLAGTGPAPDASQTTGFSVLVDAFEPRLMRRVQGIVKIATGAASTNAVFAFGGLEPGRWDVRALVPGFEKTPSGAETVPVSTGASVALVFAPPAARARLEVRVEPPANPCSCGADFARLAFLHQPPGGAQIAVAVATSLAGASYEFSSSSMVLITPPLAAGRHRWTFLDKTTGRMAAMALDLSPGATAAATVDLAGASRTVSGRVALSGAVRLSSASFAVTVSSMPGLMAYAARGAYCVLSSSTPLILSSARVELIPLGAGLPASPGPLARAGASCAAWSPSGNPLPAAIAYLGALSSDGAFSIAGVPPGAYLVRVPGDLDGSPENGDEAAPVSQSLNVITDASLELSLGQGGTLTGTATLPPGTAGRRSILISLADPSGRRIRSALRELSGGTPTTFTLERVPDGDYAVLAEDLGFPKAYAARPHRVSVSGGSGAGGDIFLEASGSVRAQLAVERLRLDGSREVSVLTDADRTLLPEKLRIAAVASPWVEGGFFPAMGTDCGVDGCTRPSFDPEGRIIVEGVLPGFYDIEFLPGSSMTGADLAPAVRSGVRVSAGVTVDLAVVRLRAAAVVSGLLSDAATGLPAAEVPVLARPSISGAGASVRRPFAAARSGADGRFALGGLDTETRFYDLVLAARDVSGGGIASKWQQSVITGVDLLSTTSLSVSLHAAIYAASGRVLSASGGPLFSASEGAAPEAGARIFIAPEGAPPLSGPLGDSVSRAAPDGSFTAGGLAPGAYRLTVTALLHVPRTFSVKITTASVSLGAVTLARGAGLHGALRRPDGSAPGEDEVRRVFAATPDMSEVLAGGLVRDPAGRIVSGYSVSGFTPGRTYRLVFLTADDEPVTPPESETLVFSSSGEARALDVVFRTPAPRVTTKSRRSAGGAYQVEFAVSQPLRSRTAADRDTAAWLSTVAARGVLSGVAISADNRRISALYTPGVAESSFTLRLGARTAVRDPDAADGSEFVAAATASYYAGLDGFSATRVSNLLGGVVAIEGDAGRLSLANGTFFADASSSVAVALRRSDELLLGARSLALAGVPAAEAVLSSLRYAQEAYPHDLLRALAATPPELRPSGPYYDILLASGTSTRLARPATLTLGYTAGADASRLNVYWYNEAANAFVLQPDVTGAALALDAFNRTVSLAVDHFSTFVLFDAAAAIISGNAYGGGELQVYNFPNPFDLAVKTVTPIHGVAPQAVRGTMLRIAVPAGLSGDARVMVFSAAGERVRTLGLGFLQGGRSYYQPWDGTNDYGRDVASGLYVGQVKVGGRSAFFKMGVLK